MRKFNFLGTKKNAFCRYRYNIFQLPVLFYVNLFKSKSKLNICNSLYSFLKNVKPKNSKQTKMTDIVYPRFKNTMEEFVENVV